MVFAPTYCSERILFRQFSLPPRTPHPLSRRTQHLKTHTSAIINHSESFRRSTDRHTQRLKIRPGSGSLSIDTTSSAFSSSSLGTHISSIHYHSYPTSTHKAELQIKVSSTTKGLNSSINVFVITTTVASS